MSNFKIIPVLNEAVDPDMNYYKDRSDMFDLKGLLDIDDFIKKNEVKEVSNPIFFNQNKLPTSDGLLSNEIFGITREERANRFAYINLHGTFLHPLVYKLWGKIDSNVKAIVHHTDTFKVNSSGEIVQDDNGETGVQFLQKNFKKIRIKGTSSNKRDRVIRLIKGTPEKKIFINKYLVIPAFYRDVNTENGKIGVGDINKLYNSIIITSKAIEDAETYGLTMVGMQSGRMQELLLQVYNYFGMGNPDMQSSGVGMPSKFGIIRRANMSKTSDYSSRLVISAPETKVENIEDMEVDMDYSLVPLASVCVNFFPYIVFWLRRFFEDVFSGSNIYKYVDKQGKIKEAEVKDYQLEFSDDRLKKEIDRFVHGYSNRFIPIRVPTVDDKLKLYMKMNISSIERRAEEKEKDEIPHYNKGTITRRLTWCDLLYQAAVDVTKDKHVLITRYPIDSFYNQFATKIRVSSTLQTEPVIVSMRGMKKEYSHYPHITEDDILKDTSNKFKDTLNICNGYLKSIGGDYDGDQVSVKGVYSVEANDELEKQMNSTSHYIGLDGKLSMRIEGEAIQSLYALTVTVKDNLLTEPKF